VLCDSVTFQPDIAAIEAAINEKTAAIIVNSPNNPTGAVFTEESIKALAELLERKEKEYAKPIYLIADEPYRELVYDGATVPYLTNYYKNTIVCYSFSKSLSLAGERIGHILLHPECDNANDIYAAICGAGRSLGYVCAPSMLQFMIPYCLGKTSDIAIYEKNRTMLYEGLSSFGYTAVKPEGAFYLFLKSPEADAYAFLERAKKHGLLFVPGDDF
jgi:aspartate aminotransferase